MNNTNLNRGDVIAIDWHGKQRIAIFNEFREPNIYPTDTLHIYIEMDPANKFESLIFKDKDYDFSYDLPSITYRLATEEEKTKLYDEICKYFAEEYDSEWYNHFSDSSYYDVLDFLLEEFDIKSDYNMPAFVHEIQNYMWDQMCEFMGQPNKVIHMDDEPFKEELVNKQEFIEKTIGYFTPILKTYCSEECVKELIDGFVNSIK
jgi:hypothetical protein